MVLPGLECLDNRNMSKQALLGEEAVSCLVCLRSPTIELLGQHITHQYGGTPNGRKVFSFELLERSSISGSLYSIPAANYRGHSVRLLFLSQMKVFASIEKRPPTRCRWYSSWKEEKCEDWNAVNRKQWSIGCHIVHCVICWL